MDTGVIIGFDYRQESFGLYFLRRFASKCTMPIACADFGMSKGCREKAEQYARVYDFHKPQVKGWFLKPFAIQAAPFERVLWCDVDILIKKNIDSLETQYPQGFVASPDPFLADAWLESPNTYSTPYCNFEVRATTVFNTGLIFTDTCTPLIRDWCKLLIEYPDRFRSDEEALATLARCGWTLRPEYQPVRAFPLKVQCLRLYPIKLRDNAKMMHYTGLQGHAELHEKISRELYEDITQQGRAK